MRCPECDALIESESARFCPQCGSALRVMKEDPPQQPTKKLRSKKPFPPLPSEKNLPELSDETTLWSGTYSVKDMAVSVFFAAVVSVGLLVAAIYFRGEPVVRWTCLIVFALIWGKMLITYLRERVGVCYRLTPIRFYHERGILFHTIDWIEVLYIDDLTIMQNLLERFLGVGSIKILSSDELHPELIIPGIDRVHEVASQFREARYEQRTRRGVHIESI